MKNANLFCRDLLLAEWDQSMEDFFDSALDELKRYSEERRFPEWDCPEPEIVEFRDYIYVELSLPGIESESIRVEVIENVLIVSGLRWCKPPHEIEGTWIPFRRVVTLPKKVSPFDLTGAYADGDVLVFNLPLAGRPPAALQTRESRSKFRRPAIRSSLASKQPDKRATTQSSR